MASNLTGKRKTLPRYIPYLLVLLQGLIYGFGDPISKKVYETVPVYSLLTARYLIALGVMLLLWGKRIWTGLKSCSPKDWLLPAVCMGGAYVCGNTAIGLTEATSVAFIRSLSTIIAPLLALIVFRKKYSRKHIPIQLFVVVGLYLLCGYGGLSGFGLGEVCALITALLLAGSLVFGQRALGRVDTLTLSAMQTAASAVFAGICALIIDGGIDLSAATAMNWGVIFYLAVLCTVAGYLLQNTALGYIPARSVALMQCFCPVMTAFFSFAVLGERLSAAGICGAVIILLCVAAETAIKDKNGEAASPQNGGD